MMLKRLFAGEELVLTHDMVMRFADTEIEPNYERWEREQKMPREFWSTMGENGLLCVDIPVEYGAPGGDFNTSMAIVWAIAQRGYGALCSSLTVHSDIVAHYILNNGTEDQKHRLLPEMAAGRCVGAIAMTEPGAGSDLQAIKTSARKGDGGWVINGSKTFITNGQNCGLVIVAARTDLTVPAAKGMTLFIVEDGTEGFCRGRNLEKLGHHASDTSELYFSDVFVKEEQVLGEINRGFYVLMDELPRERVALALSAVGGADYALELTRRYALDRSAFGSPLADLQNTRFEIARMEADLRINLAYVRECLERQSAGTLDTVSASVAKLTTTEMQGRVVDACLQLFGGYGYMLEYPIARAYADARIQRIYGGTSEIMCEVIAREVFSE